MEELPQEEAQEEESLESAESESHHRDEESGETEEESAEDGSDEYGDEEPIESEDTDNSDQNGYSTNHYSQSHHVEEGDDGSITHHYEEVHHHESVSYEHGYEDGRLLAQKQPSNYSLKDLSYSQRKQKLFDELKECGFTSLGLLQTPAFLNGQRDKLFMCNMATSKESDHWSQLYQKKIDEFKAKYGFDPERL